MIKVEDSVQPAKILVVDDVPANLKILHDTLESENYLVLAAFDGKSALETLSRITPDLIILDIMMPEMDGFELCKRLKADFRTHQIPVIFISAKDDTNDLMEAFRLGGVDYLTKPFQKEEVLARVKTHLSIHRLTRELTHKNKRLSETLEALQEANQKRETAETAFHEAEKKLSAISAQEAARWGITGFIGKSESLIRCIEDIRRLQKVDTASVLILGESGTGKELVARAIHFGGTRAEGPFVPVNCSAIPEGLVESSFFGHKRGAFSGASEDRKGYFEEASGGTLFLDEIGDMPETLQSKLLRTLEGGLVTPVGGSRSRRVHVRVIAATHCELTKKIQEGQFRQDLYFRLAGYTVLLPSLRERREDIPLLVNHFLKRFSQEMGHKKAAISPQVQDILMRYSFPGNIRELKNMIEHALIRAENGTIAPEHLQLIDVSETAKITEKPFRWTQDINPTRAIPRAESDGDRIVNYVREHENISNAECRELLNIDRFRASYLLDRLHKSGCLKRQGSRRWARYYLSEDIPKPS